MSGPNPLNNVDPDKKPHSAIIRRIDAGLMTGLCALFLSLVGVVTSRATFKMNQETQKTQVLPIIDIDMGYVRRDSYRFFEVTLNNVGAGIAYIQMATPTINGEPVTDYKAFEDAVMTRRSRGWARLTEQNAAGFLRAGKSVTPISYRWAGSNSDIDAYLAGEYGTPFDGLDVKACYCSVFEDCWTVSYIDRKRPQPVKHCGVGDVPQDQFQNYVDERAIARALKNKGQE